MRYFGNFSNTVKQGLSLEIKQHCCCIFYVLSSFLNASLSFIVRGLQPLAFTKIAYSDQLFEVSWQPPTKDQEVENYTVFWCRSHNNRDRPYQVCNVHIFSTAYLPEWKYTIHAQSTLKMCICTLMQTTIFGPKIQIS